MSWKVTPTTWTIDESKPSERFFTVKNNGWWNSTYIEAKSSAHFMCVPKEKTITAGSSETFVVIHLPNQRTSMSEMFLTFSSGPGNDRNFQIEIKKTENTIFVSKCVPNHQEQNSDFLECKICLFKYNEYELAPRLLTCGHTLCSKCAESLWNVQNRQKIICPFDRTVTSLPNSHLGINNLPKNFSLSEMLESQKDSKVVEPPSNLEPSDTPCAENPHHEATVFCVNCEADFCTRCYADIHSRKSLQSHKKLPLSEKPVPLPKCPVHPHNTAELKCQESSCSQPSKLFCHTCLLQEHKGHSYEHLQETVSKNQQELKDLVSKLCKEMEELQKDIQWQEKSISSFEPDNALLLEKRNDIINQFEEKKGIALSTFDSWADYEKRKGQEWKEHYEILSVEASEVKKYIENFRKSKVNLFCIEDVVKWAENFLDKEHEYSNELDEYDIYLSKKMNLQIKEKPIE